MTDQTDGVVTLRERVRRKAKSRLAQIIRDNPWPPDAADAILREFAIRPVAWGKVSDEEVERG
ncbi:MAG: hypothetical protein Q7T61_00825 [Caulobacter sp.]|nr:hypothetical protein [Caulobacter sp.]